FAQADLQATCAAYDPTLHEAPLVVGHPAHDLPAYGWVKSLTFNEGGIDATPAQVNPDFADMVAAGAFKKISASFYGPSAPSNPVPGVYYLRHVGFLGAQPPAVKGLRAPQFADVEEGVLTFSEWDDATNASLWRNLREWLIGKFGQAEADTVIPGDKVQSLELGAQEEIKDAAAEAATQAQAAPEATPTTQFSDPQPKENPVTPQEKAALEAENQRLTAELAAAKAAAVHGAHVAFCDAQPGVLPAWRAVAVATLDHLAAQPEVVQFGEGAARAPLAEQFKAMLGSLPAVVQFGETATTGRAALTKPEDSPLLVDAEKRHAK
ncbi:peptidase, partial [Rhodoferax sp.]|uniref:peptidase n=1 Tax=Rhodoferax sp. TaxID=50421 RepID=UPI00261060F7